MCENRRKMKEYSKLSGITQCKNNPISQNNKIFIEQMWLVRSQCNTCKRGYNLSSPCCQDLYCILHCAVSTDERTVWVCLQKCRTCCHLRCGKQFLWCLSLCGRSVLKKNDWLRLTAFTRGFAFCTVKKQFRVSILVKLKLFMQIMHHMLHLTRWCAQNLDFVRCAWLTDLFRTKLHYLS